METINYSPILSKISTTLLILTPKPNSLGTDARQTPHPPRANDEDYRLRVETEERARREALEENGRRKEVNVKDRSE